MKAVQERVVAQAREAGYQVRYVEQVRTNRWILNLTDGNGETILVLTQKRPLVSAADVQDLAELLRLGRFDRGMLLAIDGIFSAAAHRTAAELDGARISLCTVFPPAPATPQITPAFESI